MNREPIEKGNGSSDKVKKSAPQLTFRKFLNSFKRLWWVTAISCVLFASLSFAYFHITFQPRYRSQVRFTITPLVASDATNGASVYSFNYNPTLATQMATTFPHIINSGIMSDIITADLRRPFDGRVSAAAVTDTNIFEVTVTSTSPRDAYDLLQSIIKNYPSVAEYVVGDTQMKVIEGSEPVIATEPYNTGEYYDYVLMFAIIGLMIGIGIAAIDAYTRRIVTGKRDIEAYFNSKCMCEIPSVAKKRTSNAANAILKLSPTLSGFSESIRVLKQRVHLHLTRKNTKIVGITSAIAGEGKTTVAYNLAKTLSGGDGRVLLIDMDLHNRSIQNILNRKQEVSDAGITDVVAGKIGIDDVINSVSDTFDVLFAGEENIKFKKNRFQPIFDYLREQYDYIVVDMSTCGVVSETVSVADLCDEVMFVVRANAVSPEKVRDALHDMAFSDVRVMGFVINCAEIGSGDSGYKYYGRYGKRRYGYGYGYGYSHYGKDARNAYMSGGMSPHHSDFTKPD